MEDVGQPGITIHLFDEQNAFSQSCEVTAFLDRFYISAFPNVARHEFNTDPQRQQAGIDRIIHLIGGDDVYIDEKIRRKTYQDFMLEYLSNDVTGKAGWMNKDLDIDYIAYVWLESRSGYLIPWQELTRAWTYAGDGWLKRYRRYPAQNNGYKTWCVAVPRRNVLSLIEGYRFVRVP